MCRGVGNSFGFNHIEDARQYMTPTRAVEQLLEVVSRGGNLLLNVGPMANGTVSKPQVHALQGLGAFLKVYGDE